MSWLAIAAAVAAHGAQPPVLKQMTCAFSKRLSSY
jgi:hypothetical protein